MAAIIMTNDTEEDFENLTSDDEYARYPARRHGGMGKLATFFGEDEEDIDQVLSKRGPLLGKSRMPRPVAHHMRSSRSVERRDSKCESGRSSSLDVTLHHPSSSSNAPRISFHPPSSDLWQDWRTSNEFFAGENTAFDDGIQSTTASRSVTDLSFYTRVDEGERLNRGTSLSLERDQRRHMTDFSPGHILSSNSFSPSKAPATSSTSGSSTTIATPRWERRRSSSTASSHSRNSMLSLPTDSQPSQMHSSQDHADYRTSLELRAANLPPALGGRKRRHAPRVAKPKPRDPLENCRPDQVARLRRKWAMTRKVELPAKFPQQRMDLEAVTILEHRLSYRDAASTKLSSRISKMGLAKTWKKRFLIFSTNALAHPNDENNLMRWQACRSTNRWSEGVRDDEDDDSRFESMSMMTANSNRTRRKRVKGRAEGGKVDSDDGMGEAAINFVFDFDEQRYEPVSEPYACLSTYRTGADTEMEVERLLLSGDSTVTVPSKSAAEHGTDGHLLEIRGKLVSALTVKQDEKGRSSDVTTVWLLRFECVNVLMSWLKIMRSAIIALEREERFFHVGRRSLDLPGPSTYNEDYERSGAKMDNPRSPSSTHYTSSSSSLNQSGGRHENQGVLAGQARTSTYSDDRQRHSLRPPVPYSEIKSTRLSLDGHQSKKMPDPPLASDLYTEAPPTVKALAEEKMTRPINTFSKEQGPTGGEEPDQQNSFLPQSCGTSHGFRSLSRSPLSFALNTTAGMHSRSSRSEDDEEDEDTKEFTSASDPGHVRTDWSLPVETGSSPFLTMRNSVLTSKRSTNSTKSLSASIRSNTSSNAPSACSLASFASGTSHDRSPISPVMPPTPVAPLTAIIKGRESTTAASKYASTEEIQVHPSRQQQQQQQQQHGVQSPPRTRTSASSDPNKTGHGTDGMRTRLTDNSSRVRRPSLPIGILPPKTPPPQRDLPVAPHQTATVSKQVLIGNFRAVLEEKEKETKGLSAAESLTTADTDSTIESCLSGERPGALLETTNSFPCIRTESPVDPFALQSAGGFADLSNDHDVLDAEDGATFDDHIEEVAKDGSASPIETTSSIDSCRTAASSVSAPSLRPLTLSRSSSILSPTAKPSGFEARMSDQPLDVAIQSSRMASHQRSYQHSHKYSTTSSHSKTSSQASSIASMATNPRDSALIKKMEPATRSSTSAATYYPQEVSPRSTSTESTFNSGYLSCSSPPPNATVQSAHHEAYLSPAPSGLPTSPPTKSNTVSAVANDMRRGVFEQRGRYARGVPTAVLPHHLRSPGGLGDRYHFEQAQQYRKKVTSLSTIDSVSIDIMTPSNPLSGQSTPMTVSSPLQSDDAGDDKTIHGGGAAGIGLGIDYRYDEGPREGDSSKEEMRTSQFMTFKNDEFGVAL